VKNLGISSKIFILSSVVALVLIVISSAIMLSKVSDIETKVISNKMNELHNLLHSEIDAKKSVGLTNVLSIASNETLKEALITDNRDIAIDTLSSIAKDFKDNTGFKNTKTFNLI